MGQYHKLVNLDKREYVNPHRLGCGLKLWEQLASGLGTGNALIVLLASASNGQGGGDLEPATILGQWRGDRIAFVGDYDDDSSYAIGGSDEPVSGAAIYEACSTDAESKWTDVSDAVCVVIERELGGKFEGDGWRHFVEDGKSRQPAMAPDMILAVPKA